MNKDQIYAEFNVPKELSAEIDGKFYEEFDAFISSFRREPQAKNKTKIEPCEAKPTILLQYDLNQMWGMRAEIKGGRMMERLTGRDSKGVYYRHGKESGLHPFADRPPHECKEAIEKLAQYEDALEDGRLIILPVKIGDTVYYHSYYSKGVLHGKVKAITIDEHGAIITILNDAGQVIRKPIDKVYTTREEAERAKGVSK